MAPAPEMKRLLLVSSSKTHGSGYLDHCAPQLRRLFAGIRRVLFVPYALRDRGAYAERARQRFGEWGLELDSIHEAPEPRAEIAAARGLFVGGGNTFRLLKALYDEELLEPIRERVLQGMPYLGTSAGSNVACPTIMTTNDMPIVYPPSLGALALVPFQINPHYLDTRPDSTHMGETRDQRLHEFHEENDLPVVAIREGAMLAVDDDRVTVEGDPGGKLFRRGRQPDDCPPGTRIDRLLSS